MIAKTTLVYDNVELGQNVIIDDFCIIGLPNKNCEGSKTIIGDNAHIRSHTIIYAGNIIGNDFQTGNKANIREHNTIGNNVSIGTLSVVEHHVHIEDNVRIHTQAFIPEYSYLKSNAWIGPHVVLTNSKYPKSPNSKQELSGPIIGNNVKIGANCTILPGIKIGRNSLIGAGSVVTKDIESESIYAGNPAKFIRKIDY